MRPFLCSNDSNFLRFSPAIWMNFFMIRVGSLTDMAALEPNRRDTKSGLTAGEQLSRIYAAVEPLYARRDAAFRDVDARLAQEDLCRTSMDELDSSERKYIKQYFNTMIAPVLCRRRSWTRTTPSLTSRAGAAHRRAAQPQEERAARPDPRAGLPAADHLPAERQAPLSYDRGHTPRLRGRSIFEMYDVLEKDGFLRYAQRRCAARR